MRMRHKLREFGCEIVPTLKNVTYQANMKCAPSGFWGCWACWGTAGTSRATLWLTPPTHCWADRRFSGECGPHSHSLLIWAASEQQTASHQIIHWLLSAFCRAQSQQFPAKLCFLSGAAPRGNSHSTMTSFNLFQAQKPRNASTQFFRITVTQAWTIPFGKKEMGQLHPHSSEEAALKVRKVRMSICFHVKK